MTLSNLTLTSIFVICDTALTRGNYFDKHNKSHHYLTLMTDLLDKLLKYKIDICTSSTRQDQLRVPLGIGIAFSHVRSKTVSFT